MIEVEEQEEGKRLARASGPDEPRAPASGPDEPRAPAHGGISIIIPVFDEEDNLLPVYESITDVLLGMREPCEIIFVNDGSRDGSGRILDELAAAEPRVKVIHFRRNFGQTAAMMAGIDHASGEIIIPMDADGQNDPADIPRLLDELERGFDVVSGWRREREDKRFSRVLVSRIANKAISAISGVHLHDFGCSLKAYRKSCLDDIRLYGEMHRFIPIYASWQGARVTELPVNHRPRTAGQSKYGLERIFKVVLDLMVVQFLCSYETKPIYVFGGFGLFSWGISVAAGVSAVYYKLWGGKDFVETPLPLLVVMAFICGVMCILMGLLAELMMRTYFESQEKRPYAVERTANFEPQS